MMPAPHNKQKNLNSGGFSIVEMIVALALLGVASYIGSSIMTTLFKSEKTYRERSNLQKVLQTMVQTVSEKQAGAPAFKRTGKFLNATYVPFDDSTVASLQCFDNFGNPVDATSKDCFYQLSYYRLQMTDLRFSGTSDLGGLPMYRLYMRIRYNQAAPQGGSTEIKNFYASQIVTSTLKQ